MRAARTKQEHNGKERAEFDIQDEITTFDFLSATVQRHEEDEHLPETTEPEDDQDEEKRTVTIRLTAGTKTNCQSS